ncbi:unnamed protein product [Lupinus luteus]|uniref:Uncharacterized protein n=1 Tax=Lupinus luteus TaxID=3873 RepID=A0AAV1VUZ5_LUPLU
MVLTFLKGTEIKMTLFHVNLFHEKQGSGMHSNNANSHGGMYIFGVFSAFAANITYAMWFILQVTGHH